MTGISFSVTNSRASSRTASSSSLKRPSISRKSTPSKRCMNPPKNRSCGGNRGQNEENNLAIRRRQGAPERPLTSQLSADRHGCREMSARPHQRRQSDHRVHLRRVDVTQGSDDARQRGRSDRPAEAREEAEEPSRIGKPPSHEKETSKGAGGEQEQDGDVIEIDERCPRERNVRLPPRQIAPPQTVSGKEERARNQRRRDERALPEARLRDPLMNEGRGADLQQRAGGGKEHADQE